MIECAWTPGAIGVVDIVCRRGLFGVMPNRLPDPRLRGLTLKSPALRASSTPVWTIRTGRVRNRPKRCYGAGGEEMAPSSLCEPMECPDAPAERLEQVP